MVATLTGRGTVASLPRIEIIICFLVWIIHSLWAFYITWEVCSRFRHKFFLEASAFVNGYLKDNADFEWAYYSKSLKRILLVNVSHLVLFKACPLLFPKQLSKYLLLVLWIVATIYLTSVACVVTVIVLAIILGILARYTRNELISWIILVPFMAKINSIAYFSKNEEIYYREFNYYLYSAVKILNFCIYLSRNKHVTTNNSMWFRYAQYIFYPPYAIILIVLFDDFDAQMTEAEKDHPNAINYRALLLRLVRIFLWYIAFEALLHFIYVHELFFINSSLFNTLSEYELASVSYVNGQMFYMKYLLIFGIPSWFAMVDGLKPPQGPVCISRISKYSQMWRCFDRGLYVFLKKQVFIPVVGDRSGKYFVLRRFGAMVTVFLFVLLWHGTSSNYVCWVLLSGLELCFEWFGAFVSKTSFWCKIQKFVGRRGERRIIAISMLFTVVPGISGVFFFLSRRDIGLIIYRRLLAGLLGSLARMILNLPGKSLRLFLTVVHFLFLGYCYNNVCLEFEKYFAAKEIPEEKSKRKQA